DSRCETEHVEQNPIPPLFRADTAAFEPVRGALHTSHGRVKMKSLLLTVLAFGLLSSSVFAEGQPRQEGLEKKQYTRVVASSKNQRIGFFTSVTPECASAGEVEVRVTKQPEHGMVEITAATNYPNYPKENIRSKCNERKGKGMQVNYKSAEKYVGDD